MVASFFNPPMYPPNHPICIAREHAQQAQGDYSPPPGRRPAPFGSTKSAKVNVALSAPELDAVLTCQVMMQIMAAQTREHRAASVSYASCWKKTAIVHSRKCKAWSSPRQVGLVQADRCASARRHRRTAALAAADHLLTGHLALWMA